MSENNKIKDIFEKVLGTNIEIEYIKTNGLSDKETFTSFINMFDDVNQIDNDVYEMFSMDLSSITSPYNILIESLLLVIYPPGIVELILWYIYDRRTPEGEINLLEDETGKKYKLKNSNDLWNFLQKLKISNETS
jgi:hypothetical protein